MTYAIQGFIISSAPIHIADGEGGSDREGKYVATSQSRIVFENDNPKVPVIKSGTFRGGLRRAASDLIIEACAAHNVRVNAATLNTLRHGSTNAAISRDRAVSDDYKAFYANPHMGAFGGGPIMGSGFLRIGKLYPVCQETLGTGLVPPSEHDNGLKGWMLLERTTGYPKLDMVLSPNDRFSEFVEDHDQARDSILAADLGRRAKRSAKGDEPEVAPTTESKQRSSNVIAHESVLAGTAFFLDVALKPAPSGRPTDIHAGYLIEALAHFFNNYCIGGILREGYGTFNLNSVAQGLTINDAPLFELVQGSLVPAPGLSEDLVDAYHDWARNGEAWSVEELSRATGIEVGKRGRPVKEAA